MREWQRSQVPTEWRYGSRFSTCPRSSAQAITRAPASSCVRPTRSPATSLMRPSQADRHRLGEPMVASDVEVEGVVTGRDLERSGAELAVDPLVGDDRDAELGVRDDHFATDRRRDSADRPGARRRRRRRGSSLVEPWRSRSPSRPSPSANGYRIVYSVSSISSCTTSRSEMAVWWNGHQFTMRFAR